MENDTTTENPKWWEGHIPIWTSLTHQGINVSLFHWSKCNVNFTIGNETIEPKHCEQYTDANGHTDTVTDFENALVKSLDDIKDKSIDVSFVYYPMIDMIGHYYGPDDNLTKNEVTEIDQVFNRFLTKMGKDNMRDVVNLIIVADHGMTNNSNFVRFSNIDYKINCHCLDTFYRFMKN